MPARHTRPLIDLRDLPAAVGLLTRLPVKVNTAYAMSRGAAAAWAWPLVGLVVALSVIGVGAACIALGLSPMIAAGVALAVQIVITGALHEDGLADCADGFWGGWTRDRRLTIMKDSVIGTYGVLALILGGGLKWLALAPLLSNTASWPAIVAAGCLSRAFMTLSMTTLPRARPGGLSAQVGRPSWNTALVAVALAIAISVALCGWTGLGLSILGAVIARGLGCLARARIGGQTGDVLGATQSVTETALLIGALVMLPHSASG